MLKSYDVLIFYAVLSQLFKCKLGSHWSLVSRIE